MGSCCINPSTRQISVEAPFPFAKVDFNQKIQGQLTLEGGRRLSEDEVSRALEDLQALAKEFPQDKRVQLYMGIALYVKGFHEAAINPLRVGIQGRDQYVSKGCYLLGLIYLSRNNRAAAFSFLEKGLSLQSNDVQILLKLSELSLSEKTPKRALNYAQDVLKLDPTNTEAKSLLGQCFLSLGDTDSAISALTDAVNSPQKSYKALFALGNAYRRKEQYMEAIRCYKESIDLSRDCGFFLHYFSLGMTYLEMDEGRLAMESFRRGGEFGEEAHKLEVEKGFDLLFTPPDLPSHLCSLFSPSSSSVLPTLRTLRDNSNHSICAFFLGLYSFQQDNLPQARSDFIKASVLIQKHQEKPFGRFIAKKVNDFLCKLDVPMEENLQIGEIDEEHARGLIKELNTHSTPLSQTQSPDQSFSIAKEREKHSIITRSVPVEGFKVRAESLESSHTPKRVRVPSPSETFEEETRSPRGHSAIKKFLPKVEPNSADCSLF